MPWTFSWTLWWSFEYGKTRHFSIKVFYPSTQVHKWMLANSVRQTDKSKSWGQSCWTDGIEAKLLVWCSSRVWISQWGVLARFNSRVLLSARRSKRVFAGQRDFSTYLTSFVRTALTIFATRVSDRMKYNLVDHKFNVSLIGQLKKVIDVVLCRFHVCQITFLTYG